MDLQKKINVVQPSLPDLAEFIPYLEKIWDSKTLTNDGSFNQQLEKELCKYLGVQYISLFCNGTLALITAFKALGITGEVITTPYSFIATSNALKWIGLNPIFVDIEPEYLNINPHKIEASISSHTTAILPVHIYGNPCNYKMIQSVADKHGLKVIYDACHSFGVRTNNLPLLNFGDLSVLSFHATKVFTTFEGGAIICHDEATKAKIDSLKNFGINAESPIHTPGINARMNEFQAALGLLQLKKIDTDLNKRKQISYQYRKELNGILGIKFQIDMPSTRHNYSYFPIFIHEQKYGMSRDQLYDHLEQHQIFTRKYFHPLITQTPLYQNQKSAHPQKLPVAERVSNEVLCLPIYPDLESDQVKRICEIIRTK